MPLTEPTVAALGFRRCHLSNNSEQLNNDYVDEVDPRKLMVTAADAMLKSLDPYSEFEATQEQVWAQVRLLHASCVCVQKWPP
jgi:hypothetical protein